MSPRRVSGIYLRAEVHHVARPLRAVLARATCELHGAPEDGRDCAGCRAAIKFQARVIAAMRGEGE